MNRTIKFRGLRTDGKGWVYGDLLQNYIHHKSGATIQQGGCIVYEVTSESVGQLTPFKDLKGNEVYIGDIVQDIIVGLKSEVVFTDYGNIGLRPLNNEVKDLEYQTIDPSWFCTSAEIIGNIHTQDGGQEG
ncbi:YopX family protein [Sphingobacterium mizutaii]|uniref:YopX family protein n=1 Tax=Sphingobacterium mizutaii TaxID=1010 RepID=UPI0028980AE5|nr:YopX family protein [Sphingobacterium mizutaii]